MGIETATGTRHSRRAVSGGVVAPTRAPGCFEHSALFYRDHDEFLAGTLPFIAAGLEAGEPVLVAVSAARARSIEQALAEDRGRVHFIDLHALARNPARIIPLWREFVDRHGHDGRAPRGIGELAWPGRSRAELSECQRSESLLNLAFADGPASRLLCAFDLGGLRQDAIEAARARHPLAECDGVACVSDEYRPDAAFEVFEGSLPAPTSAPEHIAFSAGDLATVRAFVSGRAAQAQVGVGAVDDLVLAINEIVTNSVQYGGGGGKLRIWHERDALVCEVRDRGQIEDPLAGRVRPMRDQSGGRGLWLVNQLCDLVQIRTSPAGTVVRVHVRLG